MSVHGDFISLGFIDNEARIPLAAPDVSNHRACK
jgi:hypothetical protein